ncbi:hypothetical protein AGMMS49982_19560 [Bacteroidia bacterium]|nr:hypothetical protein AGMMS49982_19560 [Bacteroidia bacterium]
MNRDYKLGDIASCIKNDLIELGVTKLQLLKLQGFEKLSRIGALLLWNIIVIFLAFFASLFAFIALGFWFSDLVGNFAGGFALVLLLYVGIFGILFVFRNAICTGFQNKFLRELEQEFRV